MDEIVSKLSNLGYKMPNSPETKERTDRLFKKYFRIKSIRYAKDWFKEFCPIYVLEK